MVIGESVSPDAWGYSQIYIASHFSYVKKKKYVVECGPDQITWLLHDTAVMPLLNAAENSVFLYSSAPLVCSD